MNNCIFAINLKQKQNTTDFSSVVFCRKGCLFGCYYFTANFARPFSAFFIFIFVYQL